MPTTIHPLQLPEWGEFRKIWGNNVVRTDFGQIIFSRTPIAGLTIGTFIKGPKPDKQQLSQLRRIGQDNRAIFIKIEPNFVPPDQAARKNLIRLLQKSGCVAGKTLFTPTTFWIDLTKTESELLHGFSPKTRYNIRLAQKHGVEVVEENSDSAFEKYLTLMRETVERQGFYAHTEKYHRLMWEYLQTRPVKAGKAPIARLLVAKYQGEIISAWIIFVGNNFLYYPYGASSEKQKRVMANNLMLWQAIRFGQKLGLSTFDLWGREPGKGFTRFKEGYNPQVVEFLGSWDLVINPFVYYPYRLLEYLRWRLLRIKSKFVKPKF